ncbi:hypothetical protein [Hydrogenophaga sp. 2FB]|uniref:hypothetical protein n=1 Tax=Hydrogenophaga sp. 2FB TaxID=2502187 RepID=UPI00148537EA|nr:hypothetical protein [Hydrogenophaga sp. 2FB]
MPEIGSTIRRISDSSTAQSIVEMRKVFGATGSLSASSLPVRTGGEQQLATGRPPGGAEVTAAGAQQVSASKETGASTGEQHAAAPQESLDV